MEKNDQLLLQLVYMLHTSAMQGLGKIADPTGKLSKNLEYTSQTIDILDMLKEKTKGNTTDQIEKTLDVMISELKLNYVDEKGKKEEVKEDKNESNSNDGVDNKKKKSKKSKKSGPTKKTKKK